MTPTPPVVPAELPPGLTHEMMEETRQRAMQAARQIMTDAKIDPALWHIPMSAPNQKWANRPACSFPEMAAAPDPVRTALAYNLEKAAEILHRHPCEAYGLEQDCIAAAKALRAPQSSGAPLGAMDRENIKPAIYGYQYHDCIRFNGGRDVNGASPTGTVPFYDQATIDRLLASPPAAVREATLVRAAIRLRDLLTADGAPPALIIPEGIDDPNAFTQAFDDLAESIRALSLPVTGGGEAELIARLRAMPSSLNDACRTMEEAAQVLSRPDRQTP